MKVTSIRNFLLVNSFMFVCVRCFSAVVKFQKILNIMVKKLRWK